MRPLGQQDGVSLRLFDVIELAQEAREVERGSVRIRAPLRAGWPARGCSAANGDLQMVESADPADLNGHRVDRVDIEPVRDR